MRRLFAILSALSLLLCVAVCVLWVRSHFRQDVVGFIGEARWWTVRSENGHAAFIYERRNAPETHGWVLNLGSDVPPLGLWTLFYAECEHRGHWLGFRCGHTASWDVAVVVVPYWATAAASASFAALSCVMSRRRRRTMGLCASCGYDLRATPERCPECGIVPSAAATEAV